MPLKESINEIHLIKNECMNECLRHPSSKYKSAIGCQTDGKLKPNEYIKIKNSYGYKIQCMELYTINRDSWLQKENDWPFTYYQSDPKKKVDQDWRPTDNPPPPPPPPCDQLKIKF